MGTEKRGGLAPLPWSKGDEVFEFENSPRMPTDREMGVGGWTPGLIPTFMSINEFYFLGQKDLEHTWDTQDLMKVTYEAPDCPKLDRDLCFEGRPVAAKWVAGDSGWYRASIQSGVGDVFMVKFVDYGNEVECRFDQIRPLHRVFATQPPMAVRCRLKDAAPLTDTPAVRQRVRNYFDNLLDKGKASVKFLVQKTQTTQVGWPAEIALPETKDSIAQTLIQIAKEAMDHEKPSQPAPEPAEVDPPAAAEPEVPSEAGDSGTGEEIEGDVGGQEMLMMIMTGTATAEQEAVRELARWHPEVFQQLFDLPPDHPDITPLITCVN